MPSTDPDAYKNGPNPYDPGLLKTVYNFLFKGGSNVTDIAPTGSAVTIPNSNYQVPGIDVFNDFVTKVNASLNALSTKVTDTGAVDKVKTDLQAAIDTMNAKFITGQTSSTPTTATNTGSNFGWLWIVAGFLLAWFIMNRRRPL